ncbi:MULTISPECIES: hypothetical protein [unclassified Bradyrhizobium]|uniref:hypothetical protein n=1 Tax=unclassified Bradyrhizobium TaxID=2631580 RepID=UPI0028EC2643|nr:MULTISPECIES: hypothetical protein [unclassified Bradyrhizobium]
MKINRLLHETDLARTALLSKDEKRIQLRRIRDFVPTFSWSPFKHCLPGIFQARKSLLDLPKVTWADVEAAIRAKCKKHPNWLNGNIDLARLMFDHVSRSGMKAREWSFGALPVGHSSAVKFWPDFYCVEDDRPLILHSDPRRGHGLTSLARKFVFSSMYHHIATRSDFDSALFKIAVFPVDDENDCRRIKLYQMREDELIDLDVLTAAIQETYQMWFEILDEREREARRASKGTGTGGLFG